VTKTAVITGITGQDGAYLTRLLLDKNYKVYGTYRRSSSVNYWRLKELGCLEHENLKLVEFDLTDVGSCISIINKYEPDEIYNLAAQSFVGVSFEQPVATAQATGLGAVNLLEAIRLCNKAAKLYAHWMVINYREAYDIFGTSGILFNHESPLRGQEFVTRKITDAVARIKLGVQDKLQLGNMDAKRDWGFAGDYVEGMWRMLQAKEPDTFVLATNRTKSVREFTTMAFKAANIDIEWSGTGVEEKAVNSVTGDVVVDVNPVFYRPTEVELLIGDASYAKKLLGWEAKVELEELCDMMVQADLKRVESGVSF